MKNSIEILAIALSLAAMPILGAEPLYNVYDFNAGDISAITNSINANWFITDGKAAADVGAISNIVARRYFAVDSGDAVIYRTALPLVSNLNENVVMQEYSLTNDTLYIELEAMFALSVPPRDVGGDKMLLWLDASSNLCVTAGYYAKSFGASGVAAHNYKVCTNGVPVEVTPGSWHALTIKAYRAIALDIFNSAFEIYFDGQALETGAAVVDNRLQQIFEGYLGDDGKTAYYAGRLFPSLRAGSDANGICGIGANGYGGGIDTLVITNGETAVSQKYVGNSRHIVFTCDPGLLGFTCTVTNDDTNVQFTNVTAKLSGKRAEVAVLIPTNGCTVVVSDPVYTNGYSSINIKDYVPGPIVLPPGFTAKSVTIEVSSSDKLCKVASTSVEYDTVEAAVAALTKDDEITLQRSLLAAATVRVANCPHNVTLNLNGFDINGISEGGYPALEVASNTSLTIKGTGTIKAEDAESDAISSNQGALLTLAGGNYESCVRFYDSADVTVTGGRYYANSDNGRFTLEDCVNLANFNIVTNTSPFYYEVTPKLTGISMASPKLAHASAVLGLSKADSDTMMSAGSSPKIYITGIVTEPCATGARITCQVRVTLNDQGVDASGFLLQQLVQVSRDLVNWAPADVIEYSEVDANGECTVTITVNDGDGDANYFVRLYDAE